MKNRNTFNDECTRCGGGDIRVLTDTKEDGYAHDGDEAECLECGLKGMVCVDGDENGEGECTSHISWDDYEEED